MKCGVCNKDFTGRFWSIEQKCKIHPRYGFERPIICQRCAFHFCAMFDFLHGTITKQELLDYYLDCEE